MEQKSEGQWYYDEDLVCFDSEIKDLGTGLWIRYDYLLKYLKKNNYKIGWTIYSEKSSNKTYKSWRSDVFSDEDLNNFETKNYEKEEWESSFRI